MSSILKNRRYQIIFAVVIAALILVAIFLSKVLNSGTAHAGEIVFTIAKPYLGLVENASDYVIGVLVDGVHIKDHEIIFSNYKDYYLKNHEIINNWYNYLLFLKWTAFLLFIIWFFGKSIKQKMLFSLLLLLTHFLSIFSGLVMIAGIGPLVVDPNSLSELRANTVGSFLMFSLFVFWFTRNTIQIHQKFDKWGVNFRFTKKRIVEYTLLFFTFLLIKNLIVPYFNHYNYIGFLLEATRIFVSIFGYEAHVNVPYLSGDLPGRLFMAKWCLGFVTMFIFAAMVFVTRKSNKIASIYILIGLVILHIVNIIRLSVLFIFVQNNDDMELAVDHHNIYNLVVYAIIFILWVIWFEKHVFNKRIMSGNAQD